LQQQAPAGLLESVAQLQILYEAVKKNPASLDDWIKLGNMLMDTTRFAEAVEAYQKALEIEPKNVDVRVDLGTCYRNIGKPDRAVEEYNKALQINPSHPNGHRNLAVVLSSDLKQNDRAIQEFEKFLALEPHSADADTIKQIILNLKGLK